MYKKTEILESITKKYSSSTLIFRELDKADYEKNYLELLSQLTLCPKTSFEEFEDRYNTIANNNSFIIIVVENTEENKIIGSITMLIEPKFIRNNGLVCHIEDVVVDSDYRNLKLGSTLINLCKEFAKEAGCYKSILDCDEKVAGFYEKAGYSKKSLGMSLYF
jgi:glucosamine-phosphate N-acetyltransferase